MLCVKHCSSVASLAVSLACDSRFLRVAWPGAVVCLSDLISHWEKRNGTVIQELNPANLDRAELGELIKQYGGEKMYSRWAGV